MDAHVEKSDTYIISLIKNDDFQEFIKLDQTLVFTNNVRYLSACAYFGREDIARYIVYRKDQLISLLPLNYLLRLAVSSNQLSMVKLFVSLGANIRSYEDHALRIACCEGYLSIVEYLIDNGSQVYTFNNSCLQLAASNGHNSVIKLLHEKCDDLFDPQNLAIKWAYSNGHHDTVELLHQLDISNKHSINKNITVTKYIIKVKSDIHSFWTERYLYDVNGNLVNKTETVY